MMSTRLQFTAPAVVEWELCDKTYHLYEPDPRIDHVILETRFHDEDGGDGDADGDGKGDGGGKDDGKTSDLFQLHVPIQLKGLRTKTNLLVPIYPDSIVSLESETCASAPNIVLDKLKCSSVSLRFHLQRTVSIIVPASATVPVLPRRSQSGHVLDVLHSLVQVTCFTVFVPDTKFSKTTLQRIQKALDSARPKPSVHDLASLYNGTGGKIVQLHRPDDSPPSYHQIEPPPPAPPLTKPNERKRCRQDSSSQDELDGRFEAIWAELRKKDERIHELEERVKQLEADKADMADKLDTAYHENEVNAAARDEMESELLLTNEKLDSLVDQVAYINQNGLDSDVEERIADTITDRIYEEIATSFSRRT